MIVFLNGEGYSCPFYYFFLKENNLLFENIKFEYNSDLFNIYIFI